MPNRPIIQTDLDGTKSINFSDGGRWDDGQPEDELFAGILQAPTKICFEKLPDTLEEEEVTNCKPVSFWIQDVIGWENSCSDRSQVEIPTRSNSDTPLNYVAADDYSQFTINRNLPLPKASRMAPPRRYTEAVQSLRSYVTVASDVTNSTIIPLKPVPWNKGIYSEGSWPSPLTKQEMEERTKPIVTVTTLGYDGSLPVQSGIEVVEGNAPGGFVTYFRRSRRMPMGIVMINYL